MSHYPDFSSVSTTQPKQSNRNNNPSSLLNLLCYGCLMPSFTVMALYDPRETATKNDSKNHQD